MRISPFPICSSSNRVFKAPRVRGHYPQIGERLRPPFFRGPRIGREEMCYRKARAQHRQVAAIEAKERNRRMIAERLHNAGLDDIADAFHTQMLALKIEIGDLLQGIQDPKARIELQAVDDLDVVA